MSEVAGRNRKLVAALIAVSVIAAIAVGVAIGALVTSSTPAAPSPAPVAAPSDPQTEADAASAEYKASLGPVYVTHMRTNQATGVSTDPRIAAYTDEQLLAVRQAICTEKAANEPLAQIEQEMRSGFPGMSEAEAASYVLPAYQLPC